MRDLRPFVGITVHSPARNGPTSGPGSATPSAMDVFSRFFDSFGPGRRMVRVEPNRRTRPEPDPMSLDPKRVQALFLEAADHHDPRERAAILDRECSADPELR